MTQPLGSVDVDEGYSEGVVPADHLPDEGGAADLTVVPTASSTVTFVEIP